MGKGADKKQERPTDFEWTALEEPHQTRRTQILKDHPEIKKLFGHHPRSKYYCAATVALQVACAAYCSSPDTPLWQFMLITYIIGGTCSHSLTLAIHEMSHNLFFKSSDHNTYYSFFANWPLVIPYAASFKKYHMEHHRYQGVDGVDTDIPTAIEGHFFQTPLRKFLWVLFQPFFYAIRPLVINPKPLDDKNYINIASQAVFMLTLYKLCNGWALIYLLLSTFFGLGMHPCAGHFIAEHYTNIVSSRGPHLTGMTPIKQGGEKRGETLYPDETFTYRGPLNAVSYNVGVHMAHHDFPSVSGLKLFEVEKLAPEYYDHVPETTSWPGTIYKYIMSDVCSFDRVKRESVGGAKKSK